MIEKRENPLTLPNDKGTYVVMYEAKASFHINIGSLGMCHGGAGFYLYVGNAFGAGGLNARINRHARKSPKKHWHIDYIKEQCHYVETWYTTSHKKHEHHWAQLLLSMPDVYVAMNKFGASDCSCKTHLFFFKQKPSFSSFKQLVLYSPI
ncbi:MAG: GIY-YIG nuclease family protein [Rickettsiales bacterium]|nr:GIY-YIG nuclease family protein [Rickettsiales bacterium]